MTEAFCFGHLLYGTGSNPCPPHGLQLIILLVVNQKPLKAPCFLNASSPYCEQVGVYLHLDLPSQGEMAIW